MVGDARHRDPANGFAAFLAGECELQHPRQLHGVLEEAFEEVSESVEKHPFGMGCLELHVVTQHRRELRWIHLAVMGPGRGIVFRSVVFLWAFGFRCAVVWIGMATCPRSGGSISSQCGIAQFSSGSLGFSCDLREFRLPKQAPLQGVVLGLGSGPLHLRQKRNRIVPSSLAGACVHRRSTIRCCGLASRKPICR